MTLRSPFAEFCRLAARGGLVAVTETVAADLLTPLSAYLRIAQGEERSFLLESVEGGEQLARYSFLGAAPEMVVRSRQCTRGYIAPGSPRRSRRRRRAPPRTCDDLGDDDDDG